MSDLPMNHYLSCIEIQKNTDKEKYHKNLVRETQCHSNVKRFEKTAHQMQSNSLENLIFWAEKCN